jgi:SOS response regulatory protein OraA/RecX
MNEKRKVISEKQAYSRMARLCSQKEYCSYDISQKLYRLNLNAEDIERVVNRLIKENFINDERYTRSSFAWVQSDSIEVSRLHKIITTAPDGITKKTYEIQLYIYQQDPYIMSWEKVAEDYLPTTVNQQKTVEFNNKKVLTILKECL